jgi:hypothetical protein
MNRYFLGIFLAALLGGLAAFDAGAITESNTLPLSALVTS